MKEEIVVQQSSECFCRLCVQRRPDKCVAGLDPLVKKVITEMTRYPDTPASSVEPIFTLNRYQDLTKRTAGDDSLSTLALGLAGESGEVADVIKKHVGHGHPLDKEKLTKELGDVLWYIARLSDANGITLSKVAESNIEKLKKRYPDGFSSDKSINRVENT